MPFIKPVRGSGVPRTRGTIRCVAALAVALAVAGCNLDLANPNAPTEEAVLTDRDGLIALSIGMQDQYAATIGDYLVTNSLITDEWGTRQLALASYISLFTGVEIDEGYASVEAPWANSYETIKSANTLLSAQVDLGPTFGPGIRALAKLYKAMAFGMLIQQFEEVPITIDVEGPVPRPRAEVLDTLLMLLEEAETEWAAIPAAGVDELERRVTGDDIDVGNVIDAMLARYYLIDGQYQNASDAADEALAGFSGLSLFVYTLPDRNPVYLISVPTLYVAPLRSFVTEAAAGDERPTYWTDPSVSPPGNPPDSALVGFAKYQAPDAPIPIFFPDEMKLIKAEALTRLGGAANLLEAADLVNQVHTQQSSAVDEPVAGFDSPIPLTSLDTEAELLAQIAYERRYELYMQGLRWEDVRRFGASVTGEAPTIEFLPIPQQECDANPSNPCGT